MLDYEIAPSPAARHLFGKMVIHSDDNLYLSLEQTLGLAVSLVREGRESRCYSEVSELMQAGWIDPAPEGGWLLH